MLATRFYLAAFIALLLLDFVNGSNLREEMGLTSVSGDGSNPERDFRVLSNENERKKTKQPTAAPTTMMPTAKPKTSKPTKPTKRPTTRAPTTSEGNPNTPTKPSKSPVTQKPTRVPTTRSPTKPPTRRPTRSPSKTPTQKPSGNPTKEPTKSPTTTPTMSPTEVSPNIILIMADDVGYYDIGAHGNPVVHTPNIDKLSEQSIRFENFHMNPTCSPSRAGLLTGRYPTRGGVWHTIMGRSILYESEVTMPQILKKHGWTTALIGKWHLGDNYPYRPQDRGFDFVYYLRGGGVGQTPDYWGDTNFNTVFYKNGELEKTTGFCTDVLFDEAINFVSKAKTPFFLMIPTNAAHAPQSAPKEDEDLYKTLPKAASFYGMVTNLDRNIGRLDAALEKQGLKENTIFIVTSDNGSACGPDRCPFNGGDSGFKSSLFEGGHRVFMFFRWPKKGFTGGVINHLSSNVDIMPTLFDLCFIPYKPKPENAFDGISLAPILYNYRPNQIGRTEWGDMTESLAQVEKKFATRILFIENHRVKFPEMYKQTVIASSKWRYIPPKLFDVENDPQQDFDVSKKYKDIVTLLDNAYVDYWNSTQAARDGYASFKLGSLEDPVNLNAMDWYTYQMPPWDQSMIISEEGARDGKWNIEVTVPSKYRITARRFPAETSKPINAGKSQFRAAELSLDDGTTQRVTIPSSLIQEVTFDVFLQKGFTKLSVEFIPTEPKYLPLNAYYVSIAKFPPPTKAPTSFPTKNPTTAPTKYPTDSRKLDAVESKTLDREDGADSGLSEYMYHKLGPEGTGGEEAILTAYPTNAPTKRKGRNSGKH